MENTTTDYISNIIERVTRIRNFLGEDLFMATDKATAAYRENMIDLEKVIKEMSSLSSDIVKIVFKAKAEKDNLEFGDLVAINKIGLMAPKLGAAERKLYEIKKQEEVVNNEGMKLTTLGMDFSQTLVELQDISRSIITEFRHAGRAVPKSDLDTFMSIPKD